MSQKTILKTLELASLEGGKIILCRIEKPYGENSSPVVSIGVSLKGEEPDWQAHIPYANLDGLIAAKKKKKNS